MIGSGGGTGGYGGASEPKLIYAPDPEFSEEARKAKYQGSVLIHVIIDANGTPQDLKVTKALGLGLDEKAIQAVQTWRFKPGLKDGKPVNVEATVEVTFRLL